MPTKYQIIPEHVIWSFNNLLWHWQHSTPC